MKVLILGATGFLGSFLFGLAENLNYTVLGTSRYANVKSNIMTLDVTDINSFEQIIQDYHPDVIVWTLLSGEKEDVLIHSGLTNLLSIISEKTKFVLISTDALFTEGKGGYKESDQPVPLPEGASLANYVNSKIIGEKKIRENHKNHIIIRTGPLYGRDINQNIEQRTKNVMREVKENGFFNAAANLYKTFVHIEDLSKAIIELTNMEFNGTLHVGPTQKESYFTFYKNRLKQLGYDERVIKSTELNPMTHPFVPLDTSLNTYKANHLLKLPFRNA